MKKIMQFWPVILIVVIVIGLLGLQIYMDTKSDKQAMDRLKENVDIRPVANDQTLTVGGTTTNTQKPMQQATQTNSEGNATELKTTDVVVGTGATATAGKKVTVHYTGTFTNGQQFDSSVGKQPFTFTLGAGQVIEGWDVGVAGMKVGGKRKLVVPPQLGYGPDNYGPIPGNSTLLFDVELLKVE